MSFALINSLKEKRMGLLTQAKDIAAKAQAENRAMSGEEMTAYKKIIEDIKPLNEQVRMLEQAEEESRAAAWQKAADQAAKPGQDEKRFASFGEQLLAVARAEQRGAAIDPRLVEVRAASGLNEAVPSDGGFLVQTDFATEILKKTYSTGILASRCRRRNISAAANGVKMNGIDETSRANGSRYGGVQAYWANEADTVTATRPKFRQIELKLNKLFALYYATDELLQDATMLEQECMEAFSGELAFKTDDAIFRGAGAGQPLGYTAAACLTTVAAEGGQGADTVIAQNVINMWSRMWAPSRPNSVWLINQEVEPQLMVMSVAVGTGGQLIYMPAGGISGQPYATLFGRPVIPIEQAAALGDVGDITLVDLSQYLLADKGGAQAASSMHVRFIYDEMTFRLTYRVDGQPLWNSPLTPYKGAAAKTLSPFVALAAR